MRPHLILCLILLGGTFLSACLSDGGTECFRTGDSLVYARERSGMAVERGSPPLQGHPATVLDPASLRWVDGVRYVQAEGQEFWVDADEPRSYAALDLNVGMLNLWLDAGLPSRDQVFVNRVFCEGDVFLAPFRSFDQHRQFEVLEAGADGMLVHVVAPSAKEVRFNRPDPNDGTYAINYLYRFEDPHPQASRIEVYWGNDTQGRLVNQVVRLDDPPYTMPESPRPPLALTEPPASETYGWLPPMPPHGHNVTLEQAVAALSLNEGWPKDDAARDRTVVLALEYYAHKKPDGTIETWSAWLRYDNGTDLRFDAAWECDPPVRPVEDETCTLVAWRDVEARQHGHPVPHGQVQAVVPLERWVPRLYEFMRSGPPDNVMFTLFGPDGTSIDEEFGEPWGRPGWTFGWGMSRAEVHGDEVQGKELVHYQQGRTPVQAVADRHGVLEFIRFPGGKPPFEIPAGMNGDEPGDGGGVVMTPSGRS